MSCRCAHLLHRVRHHHRTDGRARTCHVWVLLGAERGRYAHRRRRHVVSDSDVTVCPKDSILTLNSNFSRDWPFGVNHQRLFCWTVQCSYACLGGAVGSVAVRAAWLRWSASLGSRPSWLTGSLCQVIAAYALRLNSLAGTEVSTVSSLICDRWLILLEPLITDGLLLYALASHQWLCSHAPLNWTLGPTVRGAHELWPSIMQ